MLVHTWGHLYWSTVDERLAVCDDKIEGTGWEPHCPGSFDSSQKLEDICCDLLACWFFRDGFLSMWFVGDNLGSSSDLYMGSHRHPRGSHTKRNTVNLLADLWTSTRCTDEVPGLVHTLE